MKTDRLFGESSLQGVTWFADDSTDSVGDGAFVERDHEFPGMVITECSIFRFCSYIT